MIKINNLSVSFKKNLALDNVSLDLPDKGFVCICGPSGSGKTTLLNCLMMLQEYIGSIIIDGKNIARMPNEDKDSFRIRNIGFVFQQFNLYENETVENNILLSLKAVTEISSFYYDTKINEALSLTNLKKYNKKIVKNLSGGEKQRVSIARSIINNPRIILADEPTGSLDSTNSVKIMEILHKISSKSLVIIVSHNVELCKKYCTSFIELCDGKISSITNNEVYNHPLIQTSVNSVKNKYRTTLDSKLIFSYVRKKLKEHKYRSFFSICVTSFALLGIGLSFSLSNIINQNVVDSYSSLTEENKIVISSNNESENNMISASLEDTLLVKNKYSNNVFDVGVCYFADYENIFTDINKASVMIDKSIKTINGISARNINEFKWLDYENVIVYPKTPEYLSDDEIVLGLNLNQIKQICHVFQIKESLEFLAEYIASTGFNLYFDFANYEIDYSDQQVFSIKGICLQSEACIYHYNHLWNEYVLEDRMRFPIKHNFKEISESWRLSKAYYLQLYDDASSFVDIVRYDEIFDKFLLEIASSKYFKNLSTTSNQNLNRLLVFENHSNLVPRYCSFIEEFVPNLSKKIYGTDKGYSIFANYFMSGFSNETFFSSDEEKLIEYCDLLDYIEQDDTISSDGILKGHFSNQNKNSVSFSVVEEKMSYMDIKISTEMAVKLFGTADISNKTIYVANQTYQDKSVKGKTISHYEFQELNVIGVVQDSKCKIYHNSDWLITYFQCYFGVSIFDLQINSIAYNTNEDFKFESAKAKIEKAFPNLSVSNPLYDIKESTSSVTKYITIILLVFNLLILFISLFLIFQTTNLYFDEIKKDIGISRCIGIPANETNKFVSFQISIIILISLVLSFIELIVVNLVLSYTLSTSFKIVFTPFAYLSMLGFAIILAFLISLIYKSKVNKISPLECLKK